MLDGSQRRNTKHESAWPFRIWYNFDRKYPFEPQITYLRACPQKFGCYIHHGHQGGLFTSWEICSNPHLCVQEVYSSPASNTSFQFFVAWTLDVPESAQFPFNCLTDKGVDNPWRARSPATWSPSWPTAVLLSRPLCLLVVARWHDASPARRPTRFGHTANYKHFFLFFKSLMCNFYTIWNIFILTFTED